MPKPSAVEFRDSAREYVQIYQYRAQYATALAEACVALRRWPRDLDDEVWRHVASLRSQGDTLQPRLAYLRNLTRKGTGA